MPHLNGPCSNRCLCLEHVRTAKAESILAEHAQAQGEPYDQSDYDTGRRI